MVHLRIVLICLCFISPSFLSSCNSLNIGKFLTIYQSIPIQSIIRISGGKTIPSKGKLKSKSFKKSSTPPSIAVQSKSKPQNKIEDEEDEEDEEDDDNNDNSSDDSDDDSKFSKKKQNSVLSFGLDRLSDLQSLSFKLGKAGIKSAIDLVSNKHVTKQQVIGKWKLMQDIQIRPGVVIHFPATIQFFKDGSLKTQFESKEYISKYEFKEKSWPHKCVITFDARACILSGESEPVSLTYKAYFKRSMMKPNVIFMRGKIYKKSGTSFWKKQKKIGKFKAVPRRYG